MTDLDKRCQHGRPAGLCTHPGCDEGEDLDEWTGPETPPATPLGYGRYPDGHIGCPRARSDMTPCCARDGRTADEGGVCVGCGVNVADCLTELVAAVTAANRLPDIEAERDTLAQQVEDLQAIHAELEAQNRALWDFVRAYDASYQRFNLAPDQVAEMLAARAALGDPDE